MESAKVHPSVMPALAPALAHFLYISKATVAFDDEALEGLLHSARHFNEANQITGLLLYDFLPSLRLAQFCQYVEGPRDSIREVRSRIERDCRHTGITYLHEGTSAERLFPTWSMGYERVSTSKGTSEVRQHLQSARAQPDRLRRVPLTLLGSFIGLSRVACP